MFSFPPALPRPSPFPTHPNPHSLFLSLIRLQTGIDENLTLNKIKLKKIRPTNQN